MVRRLAFLAVAMILAAGLVYAGDTMEAEGKVTTVTGDSVTVAGSDAEWTFVINEDTVVKAKGASHKTKDLSESGEKKTIDQFLKADQKVTVKYSKDGDKAIAKEIRVH